MDQASAYDAACAAIKAETMQWASGLSLAQIRDRFELFLAQAGGPQLESVTQSPFIIHDRPACWFTPKNLLSQRPLLYCHGGGFQIGSIRSHASLMARLATACGVRVLGFEYRLAPEHRAPAAADDCFMAYQWLLQHAEKPFALAGDSAGGALALLTAVKARDQGLVLPQALVLLSPWLDLGLRGASYRELARYDIFSKPEQLHAMARTYGGRGADFSNPALSPVFARLKDLPQIFIHAGACDITLDDAHLLAQRAEAQNVRVHLKVFPNMFHHFQIFAALPQAQDSLAEIGAFVKKLLATQRPFV